MGNFRADNIRQQAFLNVDFLEVIGTRSYEYSLYRLLNRDEIVNEFIKQYKNDRSGRKAYQPAVLLRVIFAAYYRGITSSRQNDVFLQPVCHEARSKTGCLCECRNSGRDGGRPSRAVLQGEALNNPKLLW